MHGLFKVTSQSSPEPLEVPKASSPTGKVSSIPALSAMPPSQLEVCRDSAGGGVAGGAQWESAS